jgi:triosephosphate isomerase
VTRSKLVVGNWKMHGTVKETRKLLFQLAVEWGKQCEGVDVAVCPPFTALTVAKEELENSEIKLGAQNCYFEEKGAFTGEISAVMLADLGCKYVILGHSERRTIFGETDDLVARKARASIDAGLIPIICIGETESEREADQTEAVLDRQITGSLSALRPDDNFVLAYEPVWAIGTGKTATPEQAQNAHAFIRGKLRKLFQTADSILILYGGSVKPSNARELFACPDIDGGLIGGASLVADDFIAIIDAGA